MKMEFGSYEESCNDDDECCMKISSSFSLPWFDVRVFYVRISGIQVNESTPKFLYLHHIPLSPYTLLEVNGVRSNMNSDEDDSSILRRDRIDKKSEQVTFVNTDSIRLNGSIKFEIRDKDQCVLVCVLEMNNDWSMNCETEMKSSSGFFRGKNHVVGVSDLLPCPEIEVYVAGCFSGKPIILTRTLQFNSRKKHNRKLCLMLDVIPEYESTECKKDVPVHVHDHDRLDLQVAEYRKFKSEQVEDYNMYWQRTEYVDGEDGELSWFNAGVRVGVGIGLGICVGVGIGVSLLSRSYQRSARNFKRRFI